VVNTRKGIGIGNQFLKIARQVELLIEIISLILYYLAISKYLLIMDLRLTQHHLLVCLFVCLSFCLFFCLFVCIFICLFLLIAQE